LTHRHSRWSSHAKRRKVRHKAIALRERIKEEQTKARRLLFRDLIESKGEEVCIGDYPTLGIFNAEVLCDPKIGYVHPNYRLLWPKSLSGIVRDLLRAKRY